MVGSQGNVHADDFADLTDIVRHQGNSLICDFNPGEGVFQQSLVHSVGTGQGARDIFHQVDS